MTVQAPCKVNLTLDVFPPRPDGYHDLDSVVVKFSPADEVTVEFGTPGPPSIVFSATEAEGLPAGRENLAFRAAESFFAEGAPFPLLVRLTKRLPLQAGLGGGSSDAAGVLRALAGLFPSVPADLPALAARLGSDVPLFLTDGAVRMRGRGELVEPLPAPLPPLFGVLVKPGVGVPTGPAYAALDSAPGRRTGDATGRLLAALADGAGIGAIGAAMGNDFEQAVLPAYPEVAEAHRAVAGAGAVRALLCGSGAAVFGLARDRDHARELTKALCGRFPYVHLAESLL